MDRRLPSHATDVKHIFAQVQGTQDATAGFTLCSGVAQGSDVTQRISNRITVRRITVNIAILSGSSVLPTNLRFILFRDRQCDALTPTAAQLLQFSTGLDAPIVSPRNPDSQWRFETLWDKSVIIPPNVITLPENHLTFDWRGTIDIEFTGTGSSVASASANSIFLYATSNRNTTLLPTLEGATDISFTDV